MILFMCLYTDHKLCIVFPLGFNMHSCILLIPLMPSIYSLSSSSSSRCPCHVAAWSSGGAGGGHSAVCVSLFPGGHGTLLYVGHSWPRHRFSVWQCESLPILNITPCSFLNAILKALKAFICVLMWFLSSSLNSIFFLYYFPKIQYPDILSFLFYDSFPLSFLVSHFLFPFFLSFHFPVPQVLSNENKMNTKRNHFIFLSYS